MNQLCTCLMEISLCRLMSRHVGGESEGNNLYHCSSSYC